MGTAEIIRIADAEQLQQAFDLRDAVFVDEQEISKDIEFDGLDDDCEHLMALVDGQPVGTLRLRPIDDGRAKIERVAVLRDLRGQHVGVALMRAAVERLRERGLIEARLHAQTYAEPFYARLGFVAYGDVFEEDGIPHIAMRMSLADGSEEARG